MGVSYWRRNRNWSIKRDRIRMDMLQQINQIPMNGVLDRLGIKYTVLSSSLGLWEWGKLTDGRRVNVSGNYVNDFSWKWRASWEPFAFVKWYLNLDSKGTFERFEQNYGISNNNAQPKSKTYIKKSKKIKQHYHRNW